MDPHLILNQAGKLNVYTNTWELDVPVCPCDVHANEFVASKKVRNGTIFHFGTGAHHIVGIDAAEKRRNNAVFAITASTGEYDSYIKLLIERPEVGNAYKAYFGDIYQIDGRLLPEFDVVTLFHLCEFRAEAQDHYGALSDFEMAKVLIDKLKPGGWVLFYKSSMAFDDAQKVIARLEKHGTIVREPDFKSLLVYRKRAAATARRKAAKTAKSRTKAPANRIKKKAK
jgi:hypothetical protein